MAQGDIRFDGRAILVTGAGRGMGRTHALLLASRGARIVVADNGSAMDGEDPSSTPAESVVAEIKAAGGEAVACTANLATEDGSSEAVAATVRAFGRIDGLLHNASTVPDLVPADKLSSHDIEIVLKVNAFAGLWMARAAWPHMLKNGFGRILYTTSVGVYGQDGTSPYSAAKGAAIGIMRSLADEGGKAGIFVNVIAPSARTRMTERHLSAAYAEWLFKTMPPEKVSVAAAYLMSEDCRLNGEILSLGGGRIGRIVLGENEGVMASGESIEEVRDAIPRVMADTDFFYPKNLAERSARISALFGYKG
jgi:NAD(P)-dependent dehydrogenase (short-subunit alcohol dehydrogenase family)